MNASALRRLAASRRVVVAVRSAQQRTYATPIPYGPPEEKDPQLGDYPTLPDVSRQRLPPTGWWDPLMRRNFGDTLHEKEELYSMWGPDVHKIPPSQALFQFSVAASLFGGIMLFAYLATPPKPAVPREYPYSGLVQELGGLEENKAIAEQLDSDEE